MPRPSGTEPLLLHVQQSIVHPVAAHSGDYLIVRPDARRAIVLVREVPPDYAALVEHVRAGALRAPDAGSEPQAVLAQLRALAARARPARRGPE